MGQHDYLLPFQQQLLDQVDMALEEIRAGSTSQGILLIGASGTGKSHGLDLAVTRYGAERMEGCQRITTCCRVETEAQADAKTTAAGVLTQLGRPMANKKENLARLESSMRDALRVHRVQILIFEEFHNAMLSGSPQLRGQTSRLLKNVWNQSPAGSADSWAVPDRQRGDYRLLIIISGTAKLKEVFEQDEELASRFSFMIEASQPDFQPDASYEEFQYVFRSLAERFGLSDLLDPNDEVISPRCLVACQSHYRVLEKLFQRTATLYRRQGNQGQALELLAKAFDAMPGAKHPLGNPFRWDEKEMELYFVRAEQAKRAAEAMKAAQKPKTRSRSRDA